VHVQDLMIPPVPPVLGMVNPQLAEILQGYKNALDAALLATKLISGTSSLSAHEAREPPPRMRPESRRTDVLEVCCTVAVSYALDKKQVSNYTTTIVLQLYSSGLPG